MNELFVRYFMLAVSFVTGAIPFGYLIAKHLYQVDITRQGSGNIGATNVMRTIGLYPFIITLILDAAKGYLPVIAGLMMYGGSPEWPCVFGLCAIMGHTLNPFLGWKGGKGVATSLGVFAALTPVPLMCACIVFIITASISRYISLGSLLGSLTLLITTLLMYPSVIIRLMAAVTVLLIFVRHTSNIKRLLAGNENTFSFRRKKESPHD